MSAPSLTCAALEVILNRTLAMESDVLADCGKLNGRSLALHVQNLDWRYVIEFHRGGVRVLSDTDAVPEVTVTGPLTRLMSLAWQATAGNGGVPTGLRVEGDVGLLALFNDLLARAGFDPEELMAPLVGSAAAHRVNQGLKTLFGWSRRTADTLALDTAEYLREETYTLARARDVAEWMDQVEHLRDGVDRLDARLERLES